MKVLGLDLSLKATGVCILEGGPGSPPVIRTELVPQPQVKGVEARIKRLVAIAERIVSLVELEKPDHIIIEAPAKNQQWQAASMGELHGVIKVQIYLATGQIPMVKEANEMRKFVIGKISKKAEEYEDKKGNIKRRCARKTAPTWNCARDDSGHSWPRCSIPRPSSCSTSTRRATSRGGGPTGRSREREESRSRRRSRTS